MIAHFYIKKDRLTRYGFFICRNRDGYITKQEMLQTTKKLTEKQVPTSFNKIENSFYVIENFLQENVN